MSKANDPGYIKKVVVFCGARDGKDPAIGDIAERLGFSLATDYDEIVYGSGDAGLMGRVMTGALKAKGNILGITPLFFLQAQGDVAHIIHEIPASDMHERKKLMIEHSDAAICLPGGFGTIDEAGEVLCYNDILKYTDPEKQIIPVILVNYDGYFEGFRQQLEKGIEMGFIDPQGRALFHFVEDEQEALEKLAELEAKGPLLAREYKSMHPEAQRNTTPKPPQKGGMDGPTIN